MFETNLKNSKLIIDKRANIKLVYQYIHILIWINEIHMKDFSILLCAKLRITD